VTKILRKDSASRSLVSLHSYVLKHLNENRRHEFLLELQTPPSSAEIKNAWSYTSTPQYAFTASYLIQHWIRVDGAVLS